MIKFLPIPIKALIELTTWVNRASNIKNQFFPRIKQGGVIRPWRSIYDLYHSVKLNYVKIKSILIGKDKLDLLIHLKKDLIEKIEELMEIYNYWCMVEAKPEPCISSIDNLICAVDDSEIDI